jgi:4-carboxymuconolactone decarboxylase
MKLSVLLFLTMFFGCEIALAQAPAQESKSEASQSKLETITITRADSLPTRTASEDNFTGTVRIETLFQAVSPAQASGSLVTFQPGARTAWHTHPLGQTLIVTAGVGLVQQWGQAAQEIRQGDVVHISPNQKHWHGAAPNSSMSHIAISEPVNGKSVDWLEQVSEVQYQEPTPSEAKSSTVGEQVRPSQKAIGDFAPKLADITDDVLYADVWERPELSKRDRSMITIAALIAMNRPEQLRSHLIRGRDNGVQQEEVVEIITHLAFYAGWPNAVSAIATAKEVYEKK